MNGTYRNERVEFLLEEPSMENVLREILPQILPEGFYVNGNCFLRPHQGKSDLKKSIPSKVRVASNFSIPTKIIIVQDQDSNDCIELKKELAGICLKNGNCPVLIRIACRELENWYLGDMKAIEMVYPKFIPRKHKYKAKFRVVDNCHGAYELENIIPSFQKGFGSKNIPLHMNLEKNNSVSFNHFVSGVKRFLSQ